MVMLQTPEEYFEAGRSWIFLAELEIEKDGVKEASYRSANLAVLAMANALLGICAQFIDEQKND